MADVLGHLIVDVLAGQGVDVSSASFDRTASTGLMVREERSALRTVVHYVRTASAGSRLTTEDVPAFGPGDHLHLTGITPALGESARATAEAGMQRAIERGVGVSLDVNYRASLWSRDDARSVLSTLARAATVLFASEDELDLLGTDVRLPADDVIDSLMEAGVQTLVVKRGRLGARLTDASGTIDEPGVDVPVVDPVGAGDAFVAGFLSRVASGAPPADCLRMAVLASAHAVTVQGDYEGMPEPADLAFLAGTERGVQR